MSTTCTSRSEFVFYNTDGAHGVQSDTQISTDSRNDYELAVETLLFFEVLLEVLTSAKRL